MSTSQPRCTVVQTLRRSTPRSGRPLRRSLLHQPHLLFCLPVSRYPWVFWHSARA